MDTALAVTQQQLIEAATRSWASIHSRDGCARCGGLMVAEWCQDLSDYSGQRCVQCGELIDPVILQNRRLQCGNTFGSAQIRHPQHLTPDGKLQYVRKPLDGRLAPMVRRMPGYRQNTIVS